MNSDELEFLGKRKTNASLKDNFDRLTNDSKKLTIFQKLYVNAIKSTRIEHLDLLNQALKVL